MARTTYTFISQDGESASTKRVSQANRKKIRSRAMATVRADERRNGVKRPTKRRKLSDEPDHGEPGHGEPSHDEPSAKRVKPMLVTLSKEQHMASGKTSLPAVASTENPTSETIRNEAVLRHPPLPVALVDDAGTHNLQRRSNAASLPTDSTSAPNPNHQTLNVSGFSNPFSSSPDTSTGQLLTNTLLLYCEFPGFLFVPACSPNCIFRLDSPHCLYTLPSNLDIQSNRCSSL